VTSPVLDSHVHFFVPGLSYGWAKGRHFDGPPPAYDAVRPGAAIVVEAGVDAGGELDEARGMARLAAAHDWILGFVAPLSAGPAVRDELGALVVGYRTTPAAASLGAAEHLPVDLLMSRDSWDAGLAIAAGSPDRAIVLDHGGGDAGADGWREFARSAAGIPNVIVKVSASPSLQVIERVLDLFGAERAMFGSDWPVTPDPGGQLATLLGALGASPGERRAVLTGTAERVYGVSCG